MASEIKTITSESLEAAYRALTPSQSGFTQDLMASNTIIPVLDLTADAQGTSVPEWQAQSLAFGSQTAFDIINVTGVIANSPGFYRIFGVASIVTSSASAQSGQFSMSDGLSTKIIWKVNTGAAVDEYLQVQFDFIVFLAAGESISGVTTAPVSHLTGSVRQVADVNGNIVYPSGFTPQ